MSRRKQIRRMRKLLESNDWGKRVNLTAQAMRDAALPLPPYPSARIDRFDIGPVRVVHGPSAMGKTTEAVVMGVDVGADRISVGAAVRLVRGSVSCRADGISVAHVVDHERGVVIMQGDDDQAVPLWVMALRARDRAEVGVRPWRADPVRIAFMHGSVARSRRGARTTPRPPL